MSTSRAKENDEELGPRCMGKVSHASRKSAKGDKSA